MKHKVKFAFSIVISVFSLSALSQQEELLNAPKIEFMKVIHDYGNIQQNSNGESVFLIKNSGNAPLIISKVTNSCGCIVPRWPTAPIDPGDMAEIGVKYDTHRVGSINKSLTVRSNAVNQPAVVIRVIGTVHPKEPENE
ncbi:MAG: hypothetical protein ACI865_001594 [Flavobacteriaceae bacterium]|jgi:hypothetical protein